MSTKLRLKRHGSFSIREGWFEKAINCIYEVDGNVFSKENGVALLGIGANMVTSLRYWLLATDIIDEKNKLTDFGKLLIEYDKYLDDDFSWWMIQCNIASNRKDAPIFNMIFNDFKQKNFTKESLLNFMIDLVREKYDIFGEENNINSDVSVFLRTYINEDVINPEDNLNSPLGRLDILKESEKGLYSFTSPNYGKLSYLVVYRILCNVIGEEKDSINIDDFTLEDNNPLAILKIDKNQLYMYFDQMEHNSLITINKTAGLNMIYLIKRLSDKEIFNEYFKVEK